MGSLRALVVIASLAACEKSGLEIDVIVPEGGPAPDHVRLFVGMPPADDDAKIGPEEFGVTRSGSSWVRDPMNGGDLLEVTSDRVSFGFLSEIDYAELGAVIAVGYTDNVPTSAGSLFHVKAGAGVVREFQLQLFPAVDPRKPENRMSDVQVEVWGPAPGDETCVHLHNTHPDRDLLDPHDNAFIVSPGDRDCDGFADDDVVRECTPAIHRGTRPPRVRELTCTTIETSGEGANWCVLGGPACTDDTAQDPLQCSPSRYCAPPSVCSACATSTPGAVREDCMKAPFERVTTGGGEMYGIKCHVATQQPDLMLPPRLCETAHTLPLVLPPTMTPPTCEGALITRRGAPFRDRLVVDAMEFDVKVTSNCAFELKPRGDATSNSPSVLGLVTMEVDTARSLALPIHIIVDQPTPGCDTPIAGCVFIHDITADRPAACLLGM
jgi:hypothetical protein